MLIFDRMLQFADAAGLTVSFDTEIDFKMLDVMERREAETGLLLCPCSFVPKEITVDNYEGLLLCPCGDVFRDVEKFGKCHCGIFKKGGKGSA